MNVKGYIRVTVFVDRYGQINVYLKISSMAGSGIMWIPEQPFAPDSAEEAVD